MNSDQPDQSSFGEGYTADVLWNGNLYRMELVSENGIPSRQKLGEQLQGDYPGAVVHNIYPEAPKEGDELLYVDLTKERLENLYKDN